MIKDISAKILDNVKETVMDIDQKEFEDFVNTITRSKRIFVIGAGRSGLVGKAFAMRLMHLGFDVYVVGETITPSIKPADLLIAISGSGKTASVLNVAKTAKNNGSSVSAVTSYNESDLAKLSDCVVNITGRVKNSESDYESKQLQGMHAPLTPLGTLFEMSTSIFLDSVVAKIMKTLGKQEREMKDRHTNLE